MNNVAIKKNENSNLNNINDKNNIDQTNKIINNNNSQKIQISNTEEIKDKNKQKNTTISINIKSNFKSANFHYGKHINTISSIKHTYGYELSNKKDNHLNKKEELLNPLIYFTDLSAEKLKILGSNSKSKTEKTRSKS